MRGLREPRHERYGDLGNGPVRLDALFPAVRDWTAHQKRVADLAIHSAGLAGSVERQLAEAGLRTLREVMELDEPSLLPLLGFEKVKLRDLKDHLFEFGLLPLAAVATVERLDAYLEGYDEEKHDYEIRKWLRLSRHEAELLEMVAEGAVTDLGQLLNQNRTFEQIGGAFSPFRLAAPWRHGGGIGPLLLHLAARNGYRDVVCVLLEHGAPVDALDAQGQTALDLATREGHGEIAALLRAAS